MLTSTARPLALVALLAASAAVAQDPGKTKPADKTSTDKTSAAETRLRALLQPSRQVEGTGLRSTPVAWPTRSKLEQPGSVLAVYRGDPPRTFVASLVLWPTSPREEQPLLAQRDGPAVPTVVQFPTEPLVRLYTADAKQPLPLPILAQAKKDQATEGDPTAESSTAAALKAQNPERAEPVPFAPMNLPDPFEFIQPGRFGPPAPENPNPPTLPVRTPLGRK